MNNRKLLFILALLLLTPLAHGQEAVPSSSIGQNQSMNANANPKAQPQPQLQPQPQRQFLPQAQAQPAGGQEELPPNPVPVKFEGIVVQADPLAAKSVNGDVQTFIPSRQEASAELRADWPNSGDLVLLTYVPRVEGHALADIKIAGKTIVGTIKEIAADDTWIIVRTQLPERREYEVNIPLQTSVDFKPLVSAMRQGDGIRATYVREGGINRPMRPFRLESITSDRSSGRVNPSGRLPAGHRYSLRSLYFSSSRTSSPVDTPLTFTSGVIIATAVPSSRPSSGSGWSSAPISPSYLTELQRQAGAM